MAKRRKDETTIALQVRSVMEMRVIWNNLTDLEFAAMYEHRWGLKVREVLRILGANKQNGAEANSNG